MKDWVAMPADFLASLKHFEAFKMPHDWDQG